MIAGLAGAAAAMQVARSQIGKQVAAAEQSAASLLESVDPERRTLLFAAAAVAHMEMIGRGLADAAEPTWSLLSPAGQWQVAEQVARVELGQPVAVAGWSEARRLAFDAAVRQVLARHAVVRSMPVVPPAPVVLSPEPGALPN